MSSLKVTLQALELVMFNGQQRNWIPLWELFETGSHLGVYLSSADKFNYLGTALTGEKVAVIRGLQPAANCYGEAVDLSVSRYGYPRNAGRT